MASSYGMVVETGKKREPTRLSFLGKWNDKNENGVQNAEMD
jgi:hypothetical protein